MHTTIKIENFRSILDSTYHIKPGINVLVGSNGSGKTNILTALKFLSYVIKHGAALAMGKVGGPSRNFRRGEKKIRFVVVSDYGKGKYKGTSGRFYCKWTIVVSIIEPDQIVYIAEERFEVVTRDGDVMRPVILVDIARNDTAPKTRVWIEDDALLTRSFISGSYWAPSGGPKSTAFKAVRDSLGKIVGEFKKDSPDYSVLNRLGHLHASVRRLISEISSLDEYNIQPDVARQASDPLPLTRMGNDGAAVSEVINALENHRFKRLATRSWYYQDEYFGWPSIEYGLSRMIAKDNPLDEIVSNLSAAVGSIERIGTEIDPSTGRRYVVFYSNGDRFRPEEVSDGTIKWLCLLVALFVPRSQVVLLEEPENFMHPWMQQKFIQLARQQAVKNKSSVVLSTHSVTVLNSIEVDELSIVRAVDGQTTVQGVDDKDTVTKLLKDASFGLGDLWVSGYIGGVSGEA